MECALINRAIAKKAKRNPILISIFRSERHSGCERNVRADDRMSAVHVILLVEKMHRAAESTRAAGLLAEKLSHTGVGACSASEGMPVVAVSGDDVIVGPGRRDRADNDRFLADIKMTKAADLLRLILLAGTLFKAPNQQHQREHLDLVALVGPLH